MGEILIVDQQKLNFSSKEMRISIMMVFCRITEHKILIEVSHWEQKG